MIFYDHDIQTFIMMTKPENHEFYYKPCAVAVCDGVNHRPVGNPKRKV
jgi:hypothetical protein